MLQKTPKPKREYKVGRVQPGAKKSTLTSVQFTGIEEYVRADLAEKEAKADKATTRPDIIAQFIDARFEDARGPVPANYSATEGGASATVMAQIRATPLREYEEETLEAAGYEFDTEFVITSEYQTPEGQQALIAFLKKAGAPEGILGGKAKVSKASHQQFWRDVADGKFDKDPALKENLRKIMEVDKIAACKFDTE